MSGANTGHCTTSLGYFVLLQVAALAGFGVLALILVLTDGWSTAWQRVGGYAAASTIAAMVAGVLLLIAARRQDSASDRAFLLAALLLFVATNMLVWLPWILDVSPGLGQSWTRYNWVGKLAVLGHALLSFALLPRVLQRTTGLLANPRPGSWRATLIALAGFLALGVALAFGAADPRQASLETLLFQATLPSLTEELIFRGILMGLFAGVITESWRLWGAAIGWGWLISGLLFGLVHGLVFNPLHGLLFQPVPIAATAVLGLAMGWLTARSGALWPAMLAHSFINAPGPALGMLRLAIA